ncbi:ankyrin repeat-containing protein BDA1-like [Punica granatum]|uniref:Ankyrin repeat-containing protein BDA1-like n=1 Tax=Punica granatum TaxID=22663 RepID=A0A6P8BX28_PUNGR|nr:ankyrin repeat-containing protein BDA1-like [Punica granatum]
MYTHIYIDYRARDSINNMENMLYEAAAEGDVSALQMLLWDDKLILDRVLSRCFTETPLHIAAMLGHREFVKEILSRKPEMAKELDFRKSSPLHLATAKGHVEVVKLLLSENPEVCLFRDADGRNPCHVAVIKGHTQVLKELVQAKPEAARAEIGGGNILHLCVKHYQLEALEFLLDMMGDDREFVNYLDNDGSTILHLAAADRQVEIVTLTLRKSRVELNMVNSYGFSAQDIALAHGRRHLKDIEIQESLEQAGAVQPSLRGKDQTVPVELEKNSRRHKPKREKNWLEQKRGTIMVVASLIATMAFQAGINPPEILFKENEKIKDRGDITADFINIISVSFYASACIILLLISGIPLRRRFFMWFLMVIMWVAIITIMIAFDRAVHILAQSARTAMLGGYFNFGVAGTDFVLVLIFVHTLRLIMKMVSCVRRRIKKQRSNLSSSMRQNIV